MRFGPMVVLVGFFAAVAASAGAQEQQSEQAKRGEARTDAQQDAAPRREVRTLDLGNGSTIRYEVLPGDDQEPAGELVVVHMEPPPPAATRQARVEPADQIEPRDRPAPVVQRRNVACEELRGRLAARLFELRGLDVDSDVALWVHRNLYFAGGPTPVLQLFADPLFFTALQSDATARGLAVELARCEGPLHRG